MPSINLDTKGSNSLTGNNRSSAGTFTNDVQSVGLWIDNYFPWLDVSSPWQNNGIGSVLTLDTRN